MKFSPQQYAQALYEAVEQTAPKDHDATLDKFVKILAENGDVARYPEIEAEYKRIERESKGVKETHVTFAKHHEDNSKIMDELNKIVHGKAEFKTKIDEGIIGGVVVKVDDTLIDASVKTQLESLNKSLKR
jgi:F-type H+-transporting ATPase subunit delta